MDTQWNGKTLTAEEIGTVRLSPTPTRSTVMAYTIPPPPINSQYSFSSSITILNIDWSNVRPYQKPYPKEN